MAGMRFVGGCVDGQEWVGAGAIARVDHPCVSRAGFFTQEYQFDGENLVYTRDVWPREVNRNPFPTFVLFPRLERARRWLARAVERYPYNQKV